MKKVIIALSIMIISACANQQTKTDDNKIQLFYSKNCHYCHIAINDITKAHPKLEIQMIDVAKREGYAQMLNCAKKHNLGNRIGTPLLCMGDNYMMGWSTDSINTFNNYAKPFIKQ